jgi:hypothetical protein
MDDQEWDTPAHNHMRPKSSLHVNAGMGLVIMECFLKDGGPEYLVIDRIIGWPLHKASFLAKPCMLLT